MGTVEAFLGVAIAGFGLLLMAVALMAWRRAGDRKMPVLAAAFAAQAAGGAALLAREITATDTVAPLPLVLGTALLASLVLLYGALFARRG